MAWFVVRYASFRNGSASNMWRRAAVTRCAPSAEFVADDDDSSARERPGTRLRSLRASASANTAARRCSACGASRDESCVMCSRQRLARSNEPAATSAEHWYRRLISRTLWWSWLSSCTHDPFDGENDGEYTDDDAGDDVADDSMSSWNMLRYMSKTNVARSGVPVRRSCHGTRKGQTRSGCIFGWN
uniref:Uncharacterized protein n=1 Tax=Leersia perrieri TaxID=77586 RepID=A0A0D9XNY5_9ORYZ